jgi:hypothetical protein
MTKQIFGMVAACAVAALLLSAPAKADTVSYDFSATGLNADFTLDVVGDQAIDGSGVVTSAVLGGAQNINLLTASSPGVNDLGGNNFSNRFGGGTDLIGDTSVPIDGNGLVFATNDTNDDGLNIWSNGDGSYTAFVAGNNGVYNSFVGQLTETPDPSAISCMILGLLVILGMLMWPRRRQGAYDTGSRLALPAAA